MTATRAAAIAAAAMLVAVGAAGESAAAAHSEPGNGYACGASGRVLGYSDALDKKTVGSAAIGGLSALAWDARERAWASVVDHTAGQLARIWFFRDPANPQIVGSLVLRKADGTPYDESDSDDEGLAVLPDGDYLVSSETEPSIRIFGRDGVERGHLQVPARFQVRPVGEATANATLEGLTVSADGRYVYAAMEGALSADGPQDRRILVYRAAAHHAYTLVKELGYQVEPGKRIAEVTAYGPDGLLVLEASWSPAVGNSVQVWAVPQARTGADVTALPSLATAPQAVFVGKQPVVDVDSCPSLGATSKEQQSNPLLDNFEGMHLDPRHPHQLHLISDDNFSATQTTRLVTLEVPLPRS